MQESLTIIIPIPNKVLSPNCMIASVGGRFMKAAAAKKCRKIASEAINAEEITTLPWKFVQVTPTFYCKDKRRRDEDNFQSMLKATYDGLVDSGLCDDDDSLHMHKCPPRFMVDKEHPRVELLIERVR